MDRNSARVFVALACLFVLCLQAASAQQPLPEADRVPLKERMTLKVGTNASIALGAVFVAKQFGYFDQEKLDVQFKPLPNAQDALVLLSRGRLDAITGAISAGMLNAIASGLDVRIVSALATNAAVPGISAPPPGALFVRKDLADSGEIKTYADMKGRTIGSVGGVGTAVSFIIGLYAQKGGLTLKDVTLQNYSNTDMLTALKSRRVDIAFLTAPFSQEAVEQNVAVEFASARETFGDVTQSAIIFGPNLLEANKPAGVAFMRAMVKANNELQGDYRKNEGVVSAIAQQMKVSEDAVRKSPPYSMTLDFRSDSILRMQEMFFKLGKVLSYTEPVPADRLVNRAFLEAAKKP